MMQKNGARYEYVKKSEWKPVKEQIDSILHDAAAYMKKEYGYSFCPMLVGSGKSKMVMKQIGGNTGFDFDYNLIVSPKKSTENGDVLISQLDVALKHAIKGTKYKAPEHSKSSLRLKVVDRTNSSIHHSFDVAIAYADKNGTVYALHKQKNGNYGFVPRFNRNDLATKSREIKKASRWNDVREEYKHIKNINNDENKRSFMLLKEAVNNVWNSLKNQ